jgi:hypothetical protein
MRRLLPLLCALVVLWPACAKRAAVQLPTGAGTPLPDYPIVHIQLSNPCVNARSLTAELALSGRAGNQKLRGRALAGFSDPDAMRLEGLAPFGPPAFILVARDREATLLLPRDNHVLRSADAGAILSAITGVSFGAADLKAILTGCVVPSPQATGGAQYGETWRSITLSGGATLYMQRVNDQWQLRAARRDGWRIEYPLWQGDFPRTVQLISEKPPTVDVTANISQVETNAEINPSAFTVDVPRDATPITLEELRNAGPLRGTDTR